MSFNHCQLLAMKLARTKKTPRLSIVIICPTQSALYKIYHQSQLFLVLFIEVFGVGSSYLINISPQYLSKYDWCWSALCINCVLWPSQESRPRSSHLFFASGAHCWFGVFRNVKAGHRQPQPHTGGQCKDIYKIIYAGVLTVFPTWDECHWPLGIVRQIKPVGFFEKIHF